MSLSDKVYRKNNSISQEYFYIILYTLKHMNKYIDDFRTNLKHYRETKGWSQSQLAIQANSSNGQIGNIEAGKSQPSLDLIIRIADALQIHPADLFLRDSSKIQNQALYSKYHDLIQNCEFIPEPQQAAVCNLAQTLADSSPAYTAVKY